MGKNVEGNSRGLIWKSIQIFDWMNWVNTRDTAVQSVFRPWFGKGTSGIK